MTVTQRGKYIHRVVGEDGRFLGIVNAAVHIPIRRGRTPTGEERPSWYCQHRDGHRTTGLPTLEAAVTTLWKART